MKNTQIHPWKASAINGSADVDTDLSLNNGDAKGNFYDAINTRAVRYGDQAARVKINGEEIEYPNINNPCFGGSGELSESYISIGSTTVNGHKFEVWADGSFALPVFFRINGKVVCRSEDIPWTAERPLQVEKNENALGGEVYLTDFKNAPLVFIIEDLMKNAGMTDELICTRKYFDDFNLEEHILFVGGSYEGMVFEGLATSSETADYVFTSTDYTGLPAGMYAYSFRFSDAEGNKTDFSPPTPMIPVIASINTSSGPYANALNRSRHANNSGPGSTQYGIKLAFRINNKQGYTKVEIRRTQWNNEDPLFATPSSVICGLFEVQPGELTVVRLIDRYGYEEDLGPNEEYESMSSIETCKTIRYSGRKLWLGNIKYASRQVNPEDLDFVNPTVKYINCLKKLGKKGYADPVNYAYNRSNMSREKTGYAVLFWDENGRYSFPVPIEGMENVITPSRRQEMTTAERELSYEGTPIAASDDGEVVRVHEVVDMNETIGKTNFSKFHNILDDGKRRLSNIVDDASGISLDIPDSVVEYDTFPTPGDYVHADNIGFSGFTPTSQSSSDISSLNYVVNLKVGENASSGGTNYNPKIYNPNYYSKGIAFTGLKSWPSWAKGMSIVASEPAKRVIAQGMAFYALNTSSGGLAEGTSKYTNKAWCFFPDLDPTIGIYPDWYDDFVANPGSYSIEVQAPLGYCSEIFSFKSGTFGGDSHIDMMVYAKVMKEVYDSSIGNYGINPTESPLMGLGDNYYERHVAFGKWRRNPAQNNGTFAGHVNPTLGSQINITGVNINPTNKGRGNYMELSFDTDLFHYANSGSDSGNFDSADLQNFQEPVYIINIVRKDAEIGNQNVRDYYYRGQYQKFKSLIGVSQGETSQSYELIGERWEDCIPYINGMDTSSPYLQYHRFVWVAGADGVEKRWVCTSYMTTDEAATLNENILTNGSAEVSDDTGTYTVYGTYTHEQIGDRLFINFLSIVPENRANIYVKYDNRIPIRVFGGDVNVGDAVFSPIDLQTTSSGSHDTLQFSTNIGFPYKLHKLNPTQLIANKANSGALVMNKVQDQMTVKMSSSVNTNHAKIRQMCVMFTCECRTPVIYKFNAEDSASSNLQVFPVKNYVMRPHDWDGGTDGIRGEYWDAYGETEVDNWNYGGIRFIGQVNIDQAKGQNNYVTMRSLPLIGYTEKSKFPTRITWSIERGVNVQNSPGLRTFPEFNYFDLDDNRGEIKFLWSAMSDKSENIIAITESGSFLCMTDKSMITAATGDGILTAQQGQGITVAEPIISDNGSTAGAPHEFWRAIRQNGSSLFLLSNKGPYMIFNNKMISIGNGYMKRINKYIEAIGEGYDNILSSYIDQFNKEWVIGVTKRDQGKSKHYYTSLGSSLYIVQSNQTTPLPADVSTYHIGNYIDVTGPSTIVVDATEPYDSQYGVSIGRVNQNQLSSEVTIKVPSWSPYPVKVRYKKLTGPSVWTEEIIPVAPGTSVKFTPTVGLLVNMVANTYSVTFVASSLPIAPSVDTVMNDGADALVFNYEIGGWQGRYSYRFDNYMFDFDNVWGLRNAQTFKLGTGDVISGQPIPYHLSLIHNENQIWSNEQIAVRVNSSKVPQFIEFYQDSQSCDNQEYACYLKSENMISRQGFYSLIPRNWNNRKRIQGRFLIVKIIHNLAGPFKTETVLVQHKEIP